MQCHTVLLGWEESRLYCPLMAACPIHSTPRRHFTPFYDAPQGIGSDITTLVMESDESSLSAHSPQLTS